MTNEESDAGSHKVPSVLLTPESVTRDNMQATVVKDGFVTTSDLCSGDFAALCAKAGIH
jgi:D-xylose transport system substrate-binding protein